MIIHRARIIRLKPTILRTKASLKKADNAGAAMVRPNMAGAVPAPKANMVSAPEIALPVDAAVMRTVYTSPQGKNPQHIPKRARPIQS